MLLSSAMILFVPPMSSFHVGRVPPPGGLVAHGAVGIHYDTNLLGQPNELAQTISRKYQDALDGNYEPYLSQSDMETLATNALATAFFGPSPVFEAGLELGVVKRLGIGATWSTASLGGDIEFQVLQDRYHGYGRAPLDMTIGFQVQRQGYETAIPQYLLDLLELQNVSRTDFFVPIAFGKSIGEIGYLYGGPKLFGAKIEADVFERLSDYTGKESNLTGWMWGAGGTLGLGAGWRYAYLDAEINVLTYSYYPEIMGTVIDFRGYEFYPAVGLRVQTFRQGRTRKAK